MIRILSDHCPLVIQHHCKYPTLLDYLRISWASRWTGGWIFVVIWGDGTSATNVSFFSSHVWTNSGDYTVTFTASTRIIPLCFSTNLLIHVLLLNPPLIDIFSADDQWIFLPIQRPNQTRITSSNGQTNLTPPIAGTEKDHPELWRSSSSHLYECNQGRWSSIACWRDSRLLTESGQLGLAVF